MNNTELARRTVACKHWRWMVGMLVEAGGPTNRILSVDGGIMVTIGHDDHPVVLGVDLWHVILPDLTDPATIGCLLALVRHAWVDPGIYVESQYMQGVGGYAYRVRDVYRVREKTWHRTEAGALVQMLEAAP